MESIKENKMGTMPVGKLLITMSLPTMFSMLILALYNVVDSIFVSKISEKALTAVSLAFPMQNLMTAFGVGTSVGICSIISRRLGERKNDSALVSAQTGLSLVFINIILFVLLGIFFSRPFFELYTEDLELIEMGEDYLSIVMTVSFCLFITTYCEKVLQGTGDTFHPMIIQVSGAVVNIICDPIMIFGYFGLPAMGVKGAAIATVLGQFVSMGFGIVFVRRNTYIKVDFLKPVLNKKAAKDILAVGIPSIVMQGIGTIMTSLMNGILIVYNVLATTAFGIYFKLQSFVFMPVFGLNAGLMPILGYNYGAKNKKRMIQALKLGVSIAAVLMTLGMLVFLVFPDALLKMFNASDDLLAIGRVCLRRVSLSFPLAAVSVMAGAVFQAIGDGYLSMLTSIIRQLLLLVPVAYILGKLFGLDSIWFTNIISEVFAFAISIIFFVIENKRKLNFEEK